MPKEYKATPFVKWAGGKRWFINHHCDLLPNNYNRYFEPFLGGGAVFFHLSPKSPFLADANMELINTYRALKENWQRVYELLVQHKKNHTLDYYYQIRSQTFNDIFQTAARMIYLNRTCFNGIYRVNSFGGFNVPIGTSSSIIYNTDDFEKLSQALQNTKLFNDDFSKTIAKTREGDLLFVDPPYTVCHNNNGFIQYNEHIFSWKDQERLAASLERARIRGVKIVLTNANHQSIKALYDHAGFEIIEVSRYCSISGNPENRKKYQEIVVRANIND